MFQWLNKQGVKSSDGYILQSVDRYGYHYNEGERKLRIDIEPLRDSQGEYYEEIYEASFRQWLPPHDLEVISENDIQRIKFNVDAALTFMQITHRFR